MLAAVDRWVQGPGLDISVIFLLLLMAPWHDIKDVVRTGICWASGKVDFAAKRPGEVAQLLGTFRLHQAQHNVTS